MKPTRVKLIWHSENDTDELDTYVESYAANFSEIAENALRGCTDDITEIEVYEVPAKYDEMDSFDIDLDWCNYRTSAIRE